MMAPPLFGSLRRRGPATESGAEAILFALVRDIRADVEDFGRSLERLTSGVVAARAARDDKPLEAVLASEGPVVQRLRDEIEEALRQIRTAVFRDVPDLWNACGDEIMGIDNLWNRVVGDWPLNGTGREDVAERLTRLRGFERAILLHAARLTVADRLNRHLETVRIGKAISFDAVFADEIPNREDRRAILAYLADHPGAVHGVIDMGRGIVFRVSRSAGVRLATYFAPLLAAAAGAGVAALAGELDNWLNLSGWPKGMQDATALVTAYFFVLLGAVVHVSVDALKQQRFGAGTTFLALDDVLGWLHIRYLSICASVLWVLVGTFGLGATTSNIQWGTAFLVGYSLDSLGGLFLQRFGQAVERKSDALREVISTTGPVT